MGNRVREVSADRYDAAMAGAPYGGDAAEYTAPTVAPSLKLCMQRLPGVLIPDDIMAIAAGEFVRRIWEEGQWDGNITVDPADNCIDDEYIYEFEAAGVETCDADGYALTWAACTATDENGDQWPTDFEIKEFRKFVRQYIGN